MLLEAHKISSNQYDKLQSLCEFTSGCLCLHFQKKMKIILLKKK